MNPNTKIDDPKKGWMMRQMDGNRPLPRIEVGVAPDGCARFASRVDRIAGEIAGLDIKRMYRRTGERRYLFFWAIRADFSGVTISQLNTLTAFLEATRAGDCESYVAPFGVLKDELFNTRFNSRRDTMYVVYDAELNREWSAPAEFKEV